MVADTLEGGLGAAVEAGVRHLATNGWEVTVLAPGPVGRAAGQLRDVHRPLELPRTMRALGPAWAAAGEVRRTIRYLRPEVVHCHGLRSFGITRALARQPAVLTLHGTGSAHDDPPGYHAVRRLGLATLPRMARAAFSAVPGHPAPWVFAPHASPRLATLDEQPPPDPDAPFLWLGRLDDPKQPERFVDAIAAVARSVPVRAVIAGSGPLEDRVRDRVRTSRAPVEVLGHRDDVGELLRAARAVVLLSRHEAVPFSLTEAMWAGRGVVASDLPGTRWLASPGSPAVTVTDTDDELVAALTRLADPAAAAEAGRAAAVRVRTLLDVSSPWPQIAATYEAMVG